MNIFFLLVPVLLSVAIAQVGLGLLTPLIPLLLVAHAVTTQMVGIVASSYFAGFLVGTLHLHRIVNRVGHIRAFAVFAAMAANASLLMSAIFQPFLWCLLRFVIGISAAGIFLVAESWINASASHQTRGRIFAAYTISSWSGSALGPLALHFVAGSMTLLIGACAAFTTSLLPISLTRQPSPQIGSPNRIPIRRLLALSPLGVTSCLSVGLLNSAFYAMITVVLRDAHRSDSAISLFLSCCLASGMLMQLPIGLAADRVGRRPVMLISFILSFVIAAVFAAGMHLSLPVQIGLGVVYAGLTAPLYSLGAGQAYDQASPGEMVGASSSLLFIWALGSSVGPGAAAYTMSLLGGRGLFCFLAIVLGVMTLFTVVRIRAREALPAKDQSGYMLNPPSAVQLAVVPASLVNQNGMLLRSIAKWLRRKSFHKQ